MSEAYMTKNYKGHVIGLVNGSTNKYGVRTYGDYIEIDGKVYRDELFTSDAGYPYSGAVKALKAAQRIVDEMEK